VVALVSPWGYSDAPGSTIDDAPGKGAPAVVGPGRRTVFTTVADANSEADASVDPVADTDAPPAALSGRWVDLQPVTDDDVVTLRRLASMPGVTETFRYRGRTPSPKAFAADLWADALVLFTVRSRASRRIVGMVGVIAPNFRDRHAHLVVLIDAEAHRRAWPIEAIGLLVDYVFDRFDFHKLYGQLSEPSFDAISSAVARVLDVEARLTAHEFSGGEWRDSILVALYRDRWMHESNTTRARLHRRSSPERSHA
jgi:RimJ/RimL family protein N-acetyltransferase